MSFYAGSLAARCKNHMERTLPIFAAGDASATSDTGAPARSADLTSAADTIVCGAGPPRVSVAQPVGRVAANTHGRDGSGVQHRLLKRGYAWGRRLKNTQGAWSRLRTEATNDQVSVSKHDDNGK